MRSEEDGGLERGRHGRGHRPAHVHGETHPTRRKILEDGESIAAHRDSECFRVETEGSEHAEGKAAGSLRH